MDHQQIKKLISSYYDGELDEEQKKIIKKHLEDCPECQKEFEEMGKFEEVMSKMELKKPPKEAWKIYWTSVYNRLERRIGWILFSIGVMILLFFGGYKMVEEIIKDPSISFLLKAGILAVLGGVVVLLVSLIREQLFVRKRERYKEVEK
ncbi:MAG: zf-HC2 domain-containing protein [Candidatus Aminicenantes bacterium]|nr:zf-HC2 domain-containing protein [Candidatus Aminicenantes bacterium]MBL7082235.1 zf-HC2 domain-containing protein [Candidatus Aminicenantes bacterium]